jgi:thiol-disulfide isomerase/thioredoxin
MNKRFLALIVVMAGLGGVLLYQRLAPKSKSQTLNAAVADEKALAVLRQADTACKGLVSGSFKAEFKGEGVLAATTPPARGTVQFETAKEWMRISATTTGAGGVEQTFDFASDAERVVSVDHARKMYNFGPYPYARRLLAPGLNLMIPKFGSEAPFKGELERSPKYEGVRQAEGVACDVVSITQGGNATVWYLGQNDHLPRRVEFVQNLYANKEFVDKTILAISELKSGTAFAQADFRVPTPEGYAEIEIAEPPPLLAVGAPAPNWELKTPQGQTVRLGELRGSVVVLDFWATWCGPCKMAMPHIQELHAEYEGRRVKVFGVNCQEDRSGDPEGYMKSKGYTYGLLLNGDQVANSYFVSGLPTFYVIDGRGIVVYADVGAGNEQKIKEAVRKAVEASDT